MGEDKTFRSEFEAAEAARRASAMEEARVRFESAGALATNDVETLNSLFRADPRTIRYGTTVAALVRKLAATSPPVLSV